MKSAIGFPKIGRLHFNPQPINPMKNPTTTQHTPGPWIVDVAAFSCYRSISTSARPPYEQICELPFLEPNIYDAERSANASLIAAAPELLSALVEMLEASERPHPEKWYSNVRSVARAAIAKAKGEVSP